MSEHSTPAQEDAEHHGLAHVMPLKMLIGVFVLLICLTGITVWASNTNFGEFNLVVAMVIALIKGTLVCLFFMHLWYDNKFNLFVFVSCLVFVTLFISFAMTDTHQYRNSVRGGQAPALTGDNAPKYAPDTTPPKP